MTASPSAAATDGFDRLYGAVLRSVAAELVTAEVVVRDDLRGASGQLHGGVCAALAEGAALAGTRVAPGGEGRPARALANITSLLHPVLAGTVHARAVRRHAGRTTSVWEVEMTDDAGRRCAVARVTVALDGDVDRRRLSGRRGRASPA